MGAVDRNLTLCERLFVGEGRARELPEKRFLSIILSRDERKRNKKSDAFLMVSE